MSLDGTMAPDAWVDASNDAGMPQQQQQHLNQQHHLNDDVQQHQQGLPAQAPPLHEDQLDRQLLRHLLRKYSPEDLARLVHEENTSAVSHADTASVLTSSTYSSARSDDAPSVFDSGSSIRTLSDTSSARGSIISNVSARTAKLLGRKSHGTSSARSTPYDAPPAADNQSTDTLHSNHSAASSQPDADTLPGDSAAAAAPKQKGTFMCGFCREEGIQKTCTRKNDLKRHIEDFHNMNALWFCRQRNCAKVFDWQTVYKTHLKNVHGGSRMALDDSKVTLCPQTVFACGFDSCAYVLEAPSDADSPATFKDFVAHVVKHLDDGSGPANWTYSNRIRNLLRQSAVADAWYSSWPEAERNRLEWHPQTSGVLRKRLETRHIGDLRLLVQYAIALGSNPGGIPEIHESFTIPVRDECRMQVPGHDIRRLPQPQPQQQQAMGPSHHHPQQQQQQQHQPPQAGPAEQDPFSFKISRGTPHNPQLANYYASQRRVFPTRPPVRAGRSARPPTHTIPSHPMTPQQTFQQPTSSMFDATGYWHHHQQQQQQHPSQPQHQQGPPPQQQYPMMTAGEGGIIADDLRSLRSMASSTGSGNDVDMADAQMMDSSGYMAHQHDFSNPPYHVGLQSPAASDAGIKMEAPGPIGAYDAPAGY